MSGRGRKFRDSRSALATLGVPSQLGLPETLSQQSLADTDGLAGCGHTPPDERRVPGQPGS